MIPPCNNPSLYQEQLDQKSARIEKLLAEFSAPEASLELSVYPSPMAAFRFRAEFAIWHEENDFNYVMRDKLSKERINITHYPIGSMLIQDLMPVIKQHIHRRALLRHKLFQVEFLTSRKGEALISLIYHKRLDESWQKEAAALKNQLIQQVSELQGLHLIGRSRKQKVILEQDSIEEIFTVGDEKQKTAFTYQQIDNSFTQPNAFVNEAMLNWAWEVTQAEKKETRGDLLELYCGNGNFTLPLAQNFNQVLATELSKSSIRALQVNLEKNNIQNIHFARLSSEEVTQALNKERPFRRLAHIDLDSFNFSTVFIDPPRAGLDEKTLSFVQQFKNICYISCNPETLTENMKTLSQTHNIKNTALFDQFPYTDHIECGLFLSQK